MFALVSMSQLYQHLKFFPSKHKQAFDVSCVYILEIPIRPRNPFILISYWNSDKITVLKVSDGLVELDGSLIYNTIDTPDNKAAGK